MGYSMVEISTTEMYNVHIQCRERILPACDISQASSTLTAFTHITRTSISQKHAVLELWLNAALPGAENLSVLSPNRILPHRLIRDQLLVSPVSSTDALRMMRLMLKARISIKTVQFGEIKAAWASNDRIGYL